MYSLSAADDNHLLFFPWCMLKCAASSRQERGASSNEFCFSFVDVAAF
jgi:hypothetical protein